MNAKKFVVVAFDKYQRLLNQCQNEPERVPDITKEEKTESPVEEEESEPVINASTEAIKEIAESEPPSLPDLPTPATPDISQTPAPPVIKRKVAPPPGLPIKKRSWRKDWTELKDAL